MTAFCRYKNIIIKVIVCPIFPQPLFISYLYQSNYSYFTYVWLSFCFLFEMFARLYMFLLECNCSFLFKEMLMDFSFLKKEMLILLFRMVLLQLPTMTQTMFPGSRPRHLILQQTIARRQKKTNLVRKRYGPPMTSNPCSSKQSISGLQSRTLKLCCGVGRKSTKR